MFPISISKKLAAGIVALSLGVTFLIGQSAAYADSGDPTQCFVGATPYADGTTLQVNDVTYLCVNGDWTVSGTSDSVPALPPASLSSRGSQTTYTAVKTPETIEGHVYAQGTGFGQKILAPCAKLVC